MSCIVVGLVVIIFVVVIFLVVGNKVNKFIKLMFICESGVKLKIF